jgi:hypothetical protein
MPSDNHVKRAMSLIEADKTKVLSMTVGSRENVQPGQFIPRSGKKPVLEKYLN